MRHIPAGLLTRAFAWGFVAVSALVFLLAAGGVESVVSATGADRARVSCSFYSYTKRFTSLSHVVLGFALGIAPAAAWIAIRGFARCADPVADGRGHALDGGIRHHLLLPGLRVRPARRAVQPAADGSESRARCGWRGCFTSVCSCACWRWSTRFRLDRSQWRASAVVAALLLWEHRLVHADDLSRVDAAFFTVNGYVSVLFFLFWTADVFLSARSA